MNESFASTSSVQSTFVDNDLELSEDDESKLNKLDSTNRTEVITLLKDWMKAGLVTKGAIENNLYPLFYKGFVKLQHSECSYCSTIIKVKTTGNTTWRHKNAKCVDMDRKGPGEAVDISDEIALYCSKSGASFKSLESEHFQELLSSVVTKLGGPRLSSKLMFPNRKDIRSKVEQMFEEAKSEIGAKILKKIGQRGVNLIVDFGRHFSDYLSGFVVVLNESNASLTLEVLPFCFKSTKLAKTADRIQDMLIEAGEVFGLTEEQVLSMQLVSDSAANMEAASRGFAGWVRCTCHVLQKVSERTLKPPKVIENSLSLEEIHTLKRIDVAVSGATKFARLIHDRKNNVGLDKLPALHVATRWQSTVHCTRDVIPLCTTLSTCHDIVIRKEASELISQLPDLMSVKEVLLHFEDLILLFEQSRVTMHLVIPHLQDLDYQFSTMMEAATEGSATHVLSKSALLHVQHYFENVVTPLHCAATLLNPQTKTFVFNNKEDSESLKKGIQYVESILEKLPHENIDLPPVKKRIYGRAQRRTPVDELKSYLSEFVAETESEDPLVYWSSNRTHFPSIYKVAKEVYAYLSSETICERSFSVVKRVVSRERSSLDPALVEKLMMLYFYKNRLM